MEIELPEHLDYNSAMEQYDEDAVPRVAQVKMVNLSHQRRLSSREEN